MINNVVNRALAAKKKSLVLLLMWTIGVAVMASPSVIIDEIAYELDEETHTAE